MVAVTYRDRRLQKLNVVYRMLTKCLDTWKVALGLEVWRLGIYRAYILPYASQDLVP